MEEAQGPIPEGQAFGAFEGATLLSRDDAHGFLYRVRHATLGRELLLRVVPADGSTEEGIERFMDRCRRLAALNHPNVGRVVDFGRKDALLFLAMEGDAAPESSAPHAPTDLARGLEALHAEGLVHGNVVRESLAREAGGTSYLTNFAPLPTGAPPADRAALNSILPARPPRRRFPLLAGFAMLLFITGTAAISLYYSSEEPTGTLISRIDPERDSVLGTWTVEEGALLCRGKVSPARIQIPAEVPEEYDLVLEGLRVFPPVEGELPGEVHIGLLIGGKQAAVRLDARPGEGFRSGLGQIDGKPAYENESTRPGRVLSSDRAHSVACSVRRGTVRVQVDGRTVLEWEGEPERLSLHPVTWMPRKDRIFFAVSRTGCRLESIALRPVEK